MYVRTFNILIIIAALVGCGSRSSIAPVIDYNQPSNTKVAYHIVAPGETLYSIAWRYGLDYKKLAKSNDIDRYYTIFPGQKIHLFTPILAPLIGANNPASSRVAIPETHAEVVSTLPHHRSIKAPEEVKKPTGVDFSAGKLVWNWPAKGKIVKRFSSKTGINKGIDISGNLGEPVLAAAPGTVVYSGEGLRGYGKLIIIKHTEKYLSAYAHNERILVREGDNVGANEKVAEMGKSGADSVMLHFEIRFDGRPVDPLAYLPPK